MASVAVEVMSLKQIEGYLSLVLHPIEAIDRAMGSAISLQDY
jgi:hypothetical protein